jgi:hypothetical protein
MPQYVLVPHVTEKVDLILSGDINLTRLIKHQNNFDPCVL